MDPVVDKAGGWKTGGSGRNRTDVNGFAGRCMTTLPPSLRESGTLAQAPRELQGPSMNQKKARWRRHRAFESGAGNRIRTGDPNLGKVVLYQLSYSRLHEGAYFRARRLSVKAPFCKGPVRLRAHPRPGESRARRPAGSGTSTTGSDPPRRTTAACQRSRSAFQRYHAARAAGTARSSARGS